MITLRFGTSTNGLSGAHLPPTRPPLANAEPAPIHCVCCGWCAVRSFSGSHWATAALFLEHYITQAPLVTKRGIRIFYWFKCGAQLVRRGGRRSADCDCLRTETFHCFYSITHNTTDFFSLGDLALERRARMAAIKRLRWFQNVSCLLSADHWRRQWFWDSRLQTQRNCWRFLWLRVSMWPYGQFN